MQHFLQELQEKTQLLHLAFQCFIYIFNQPQNFLKKFLKFSFAFYILWSIIVFSESRHPLLDRTYSSSFSLDTGSLLQFKLTEAFVFLELFCALRCSTALFLAAHSAGIALWPVLLVHILHKKVTS